MKITEMVETKIKDIHLKTQLRNKEQNNHADEKRIREKA